MDLNTSALAEKEKKKRSKKKKKKKKRKRKERKRCSVLRHNEVHICGRREVASHCVLQQEEEEKSENPFIVRAKSNNGVHTVTAVGF